MNNEQFEKKKPTTKYIIIAAVAIIACVGIGIAAALLLKNNSPDSNDGTVSTDTTIPFEENTEETQRITDETVQKYADIKVEGYQDVDTESFTGKAVVVTVRNSSNETVSLAITMGAYDSDGNLLDTSSLYAEGIQPDQTNTFNTFVYTELTPEQMQSATFKVYKATTYDAQGGETTIVEEGAENLAPAEESTGEATDASAEAQTIEE